MRILRSIVVVLAAAALPLSALADGQQAIPAVCGTPKDSNVSVGTSLVNVPTTPIPNRAWVDLCNSPDNSFTAIVTCRRDGVAPVNGGPGVKLQKADCWRFATLATTVISCISDTGGTVLNITECTRVY